MLKLLLGSSAPLASKLFVEKVRRQTFSVGFYRGTCHGIPFELAFTSQVHFLQTCWACTSRFSFETKKNTMLFADLLGLHFAVRIRNREKTLRNRHANALSIPARERAMTFSNTQRFWCHSCMPIAPAHVVWRVLAACSVQLFHSSFGARSPNGSTARRWQDGEEEL